MPRMRHTKTGAVVDMTDREARAYLRSGWVPEDQPVDDGETSPVPTHADEVLAAVAGDKDKALAALEAETNRDEPDPELLSALEQIITDPED